MVITSLCQCASCGRQFGNRYFFLIQKPPSTALKCRQGGSGLEIPYLVYSGSLLASTAIVGTIFWLTWGYLIGEHESSTTSNPPLNNSGSSQMISEVTPQNPWTEACHQKRMVMVSTGARSFSPSAALLSGHLLEPCWLPPRRTESDQRIHPSMSFKPLPSSPYPSHSR